MKLGQTVRLSLYQFWLGAVSVLMLGTLNRILRVEMGLDLALVGLLLGGAHYLAALISIPIGHRSDVHAFSGLDGQGALSIARDHNPAYRRATAQADATGADVRASFGAFLPNLKRSALEPKSSRSPSAQDPGADHSIP